MRCAFLMACMRALGAAIPLLLGLPRVALASPALLVPLARALHAAPPTALGASATAQASAASSTSQQACFPMCVVPMKGQSVQQTINAIEQAGHCTISTPPATCKPASATYWSTMQFSAQGLQTLERLEGWSNQNNPAKGEIPGVCYDDSAGHGTVGYGHEYPRGHNCAWYMNHSNNAYSRQYEYYKQHPLTEGSPVAVQLLEQDVQIKAVAPIEQLVHVQLTQQQFDALVIWVFNVGGNGFSISDSLKDINACDMNTVPSDFTHFDHITVNKKKMVSCGLYRRDMVSSEIWISGAYTVPRDTFTCPPKSVK